MPKVVASRTLAEPLEWNARLLQGELTETSGVTLLRYEPLRVG